MFCKNCGKDITDDSKFCAGCGKGQDVTLTIEQAEKSQKDAQIEFARVCAKNDVSKNFALVIITILTCIGIPLLMLIPFFSITIEIERYILYSESWNIYQMISGRTTGEGTFLGLFSYDGNSQYTPSSVITWEVIVFLLSGLILLFSVVMLISVIKGLVKGEYRMGSQKQNDKFVNEFIKDENNSTTLQSEFENLSKVKATEFIPAIIGNLIFWAVPAILFLVAHVQFSSVLVGGDEIVSDFIGGLFPVIFAVFAGLIILARTLISVTFRLKIAEKARDFF
ncbi:MAG: zinc-ribbon domain-containing protein [Firmicutes bacterium]|nr:zinc-ribbon domain-containing protein [Bacillota bacterium]